MSQIEESIEVGVPVATAYNQWTQFEDFPTFMDNVESIEQIDDTHLHWVVSLAGRREEFDAVITEQVPDTRIAWTTTEGPRHSGAVDFHPLGADRTQLMVVMDTEQRGLGDRAATGVVGRGIRADLKRFKQMIERRGHESGAWRGEVPRG